MHEHDLDLIAAAAGGDPDADQAEAARLVADCDECRQEWDAQRTAIAALTAAPPAVLDDLERARLHRAVTAALEDDRPHTRPGSPRSGLAVHQTCSRRSGSSRGRRRRARCRISPSGRRRHRHLRAGAPEAGADLTTGDQTFDTPC